MQHLIKMSGQVASNQLPSENGHYCFQNYSQIPE
uniref:Uncharacterized protein n=1 Tax=Arundo donax TaxID=35708 RepID=A0A0A9BP53_ARUDO